MPARLAQHLVSRGLLSAQAVEDAQRRRAAHGGALDTALLEAGAIAEPGMLQALADVSGLRPVNLADFEPNPEMSRFVPANVADRLGAVPLSVDGATLHVACSYPPPSKDLEEVSVLLGKKLETWVAVEARVRDWIAAVYGTPLSPRFAALLALLDPGRAPPPPPLKLETPKAQPAAAGAAGKVIEVQEATLEDALTREMVEQIARAVAEEPILLEVRKKPKVAELPEAEKTVVADLRDLQRATAERTEPTQPIDVRDLAALTARDETRRVDLTQLASSEGARPATWDRDSTVALDLGALAKKSVTLREEPEPAPPPAPSAGPVAPAIPPVQQPPPAAARSTVPEFPSVVVFPDPTPAPPDQPAPAAPAPPPSAPAVSEVDAEVPAWTLAQAREALRASLGDRDQLIDVALRFARRTFEYAAAFAVVRGAAVGWAARGLGAEAFRNAPPTIPLDAPSVFRTVTITRGSYVGPVPQDANTAGYLAQMQRAPRVAFLFPVEVKGRLICLLYADPGKHPISQRRLAELLLFCQDLPAAFHELIASRKQRFAASPAAALSLDDVASAPMPSAGMGWSPSDPGGPHGGGRTATRAHVLIEDPSRPPPDFTPILRKLTGPDAAARAGAVAELARTPGPSARVLVENFPGPTAWSRLPVAELPDADELGPIPGALSRLGREGAQALAPLLDSDDPEIRYFALLTAGALPFPELVGGVLRGLFDLEPDISSAARAAAAALRKLPRLQDALPELRRELAAVDTLRRSLAARALGVLRDRGAIDGLINLTGSDDELSAQAAAEALAEITRMDFGVDPRRWSAWWAENRGRTRGQWLVTALRHPEGDVRLSAIEELSRVLNDTLGYEADAPPDQREAAARRWEAALTQNPRLKRVE